MLQVQYDVSLQAYNTMGVEAIARAFAEVFSDKDIHKLTSLSEWNDKKLVLGGGSNMLFVHNFDGLVVKNSITGKRIESETDTHVIVKLGAGENWHECVSYCIDQGWGGIENLSLIPGTVGAAPIQNIGAYGVELKDVFYSLEAFDMKSKEVKMFDKQACDFGYRDSFFKKEGKGRYIITSVSLKLDKNPKINDSYGALSGYLRDRGISNPSIKDLSEAVIATRQSKLPDPTQLGNCGSFFKNPVISLSQFEDLLQLHDSIPSYPAEEGKVKVPAGWLIDKAGLKGAREGNVGTYPKQALVIVNYGENKGACVWNFAQSIQRKVKNIFGIELIPEVNILE